MNKKLLISLSLLLGLFLASCSSPLGTNYAGDWYEKDDPEKEAILTIKENGDIYATIDNEIYGIFKQQVKEISSIEYEFTVKSKTCNIKFDSVIAGTMTYDGKTINIVKK